MKNVVKNIELSDVVIVSANDLTTGQKNKSPEGAVGFIKTLDVSSVQRSYFDKLEAAFKAAGYELVRIGGTTKKSTIFAVIVIPPTNAEIDELVASEPDNSIGETIIGNDGTEYAVFGDKKLRTVSAIFAKRSFDKSSAKIIKIDGKYWGDREPMAAVARINNGQRVVVLRNAINNYGQTLIGFGTDVRSLKFDKNIGFII